MMEFVGIFSTVVFGLAGAWTLMFRAIEGRWPWHSEDRQSNDRAYDAAYEVIAASIENEPRDWAGDDHNLINRKKRISVWIANEDYGLGIKLDGSRASPKDGTPSTTARKRLWTAVKRHHAALIVDRFRDGEAA